MPPKSSPFRITIHPPTDDEDGSEDSHSEGRVTAEQDAPSASGAITPLAGPGLPFRPGSSSVTGRAYPTLNRSHNIERYRAVSGNQTSQPLPESPYAPPHGPSPLRHAMSAFPVTSYNASPSGTGSGLARSPALPGPSFHSTPGNFGLERQYTSSYASTPRPPSHSGQAPNSRVDVILPSERRNAFAGSDSMDLLPTTSGGRPGTRGRGRGSNHSSNPRTPSRSDKEPNSMATAIPPRGSGRRNAFSGSDDIQILPPGSEDTPGTPGRGSNPASNPRTPSRPMLELVPPGAPRPGFSNFPRSTSRSRPGESSRGTPRPLDTDIPSIPGASNRGFQTNPFVASSSSVRQMDPRPLGTDMPSIPGASNRGFHPNPFLASSSSARQMDPRQYLTYPEYMRLYGPGSGYDRMLQTPQFPQASSIGFQPNPSSAPPSSARQSAPRGSNPFGQGFQPDRMAQLTQTSRQVPSAGSSSARQAAPRVYNPFGEHVHPDRMAQALQPSRQVPNAESQSGGSSDNDQVDYGVIPSHSAFIREEMAMLALTRPGASEAERNATFDSLVSMPVPGSSTRQAAHAVPIDISLRDEMILRNAPSSDRAREIRARRTGTGGIEDVMSVVERYDREENPFSWTEGRMPLASLPPSLPFAEEDGIPHGWIRPDPSGDPEPEVPGFGHPTEPILRLKGSFGEDGVLGGGEYMIKGEFVHFPSCECERCKARRRRKEKRRTDEDGSRCRPWDTDGGDGDGPDGPGGGGGKGGSGMQEEMDDLYS